MQKLRKLIDTGGSEDRAVSPVIGVILMVAITVILAAVIGSFVLDLGQSAGQSAPQASFSVDFEASSDKVTIEHTGGDGINSGNTRVTLENTTNGDEIIFQPNGSDSLTIGDEAVINVSSTASMTGWGYTDANTTDFTGIGSGNQYELVIIDVETQKTVFRGTFTA